MGFKIKNLVGVAGYALSGKDMLCSVLRAICADDSQRIRRFAFADILKNQLDSLLVESIGISAHTIDPKEKALIRPLLVFWGNDFIRERIDYDYWVKKIEKSVEDWRSKGGGVIITDVRYSNEVDWIHKLGGVVIYVEKNGNIPPNETEKKTLKSVITSADFHLKWDHFNGDERLAREKVKQFLKENKGLWTE